MDLRRRTGRRLGDASLKTNGVVERISKLAAMAWQEACALHAMPEHTCLLHTAC